MTDLDAPPTAWHRAVRQQRLMVGATITILVVAFAIFAPFFAPYGEQEVVGPPYSDQGFLGTDYLGQSVLARVKYGGTSILVVAVLATVIGMVIGVLVGVVAAYWGGWWDEIMMRLNDVALAFPQILLVLVVLTNVTPTNWLIALLIGVSHAPRVARVARGVALGVVSRDFVVAAEALGERRSRVILAEVLPNMSTPLLAEAGLRLTYSIGLIGGLGFLGFSADGGAANWGLMVNENKLGLSTQPWCVLAPVLMIAIFAIGTNLMADGIARLAQREGGSDS